MSKRYDTKAASEYLLQHGVKVAAGTLEVWRHYKRGPAYVRIGRKPYYPEASLNAFMAGESVKTIDSVATEA